MIRDVANGCILPPVKLISTRVLMIVLALVLGAAGSASAQNSVFSLALSGGFAGSLDEDTGFSNATFQARFAIETAQHQFLAFRLGRMDYSGASFSLLTEATIDYLTVAGEYMFTEGNYESGFFLGLGLYDVTGVQVDGKDGNQASIGIIVGAAGEFDVAESWFVYGEAAFHYVNLDAAQMFADVQIGLGFRF
jgi:hypothetical protein